MTTEELIAFLQEHAKPVTVDVRVPECPRCTFRGDDFDIEDATVILSPGPGGGGWVTLHLKER